VTDEEAKMLIENAKERKKRLKKEKEAKKKHVLGGGASITDMVSEDDQADYDEDDES
jgi:hypothetical protein